MLVGLGYPASAVELEGGVAVAVAVVPVCNNRRRRAMLHGRAKACTNMVYPSAGSSAALKPRITAYVICHRHS